MTEMIFADTFYWVALLSPRDAFHGQAIAITAKLGKTKIITTDEVLSEVLNFLSDGGVKLRERTKYGSAVTQCGFRKGSCIISVSYNVFGWIGFV
jgi:predicted nucleic acid-binding protein